jgi:hypothetical protein
MCRSKKARDEVGQKSREWVAGHHDSGAVAKMHLDLYKRFFNE